MQTKINEKMEERKQKDKDPLAVVSKLQETIMQKMQSIIEKLKFKEIMAMRNSGEQSGMDQTAAFKF